MKILMTGGSGLLGQEILKLDPTIYAPSSSMLDIKYYEYTEREILKYSPEVVLHLAANTECHKMNERPRLGIRDNIIGTANVALACVALGIRLVYTSTDYVYSSYGPHRETEPVLPSYNFAWSKLGGECSVAMVPKSLILRLSFGPVPFPWEKVYEGQWNSKLYVDEIAPLVLAAAYSNATGIMNLGGPVMTLEDYARRSRPDIETIPCPSWVPKDTSLDLTRMETEL